MILQIETQGLPIWAQVVVAIITAIGGFSAAWFTFKSQVKSIRVELERVKIEGRKSDSEVSANYYKTLMDIQTEQYQRVLQINKKQEEKISEYESREKDLERQISELRDEVNNLKYKFLLNSKFAKDTFPFPRWKKDSKRRLVEVDELYVNTYYEPAGIKAVDAIGKTDIELWGDQIGEGWSKGDDYVYINKSTYIGIEKTIKNGIKTFELVIKFPSIITNDVVQQTEGFVMPITSQLIKDFMLLMEIPLCEEIAKNL